LYMCVWVYICMHICMWKDTWVHTDAMCVQSACVFVHVACTHTGLHVCVYTYIYTRTLVYICSWKDTWVHTDAMCVHANICTHIWVCTCECMCVHLHMYVWKDTVCACRVCAYKYRDTCLCLYLVYVCVLNVCVGIYIYIGIHERPYGRIQIHCMRIGIHGYVSGFVHVCSCIHIYMIKTPCVHTNLRMCVCMRAYMNAAFTCGCIHF